MRERVAFSKERLAVALPALTEAAGRGTVIDLVKAYLRANTDRMNLPAYVLVAEALRDAFPCE